MEKSYIYNGLSFVPYSKMWFEIKGHKFAVSLFIIEIHFSGGKVKLFFTISASWNFAGRDEEEKRQKD